LPSIGRWQDVDTVPGELTGSTIFFFGSVEGKAELVIDFRTKDCAEKRAIFGFTELGMWIESMSDLHQPSLDASLKGKDED
jgi:hypothetical protein